MPAKPGEIFPLPVTLQTRAGAPVSYASKTALTNAGWSFNYVIAGVAVVSPTWTWAVIDAATGRHEIELTLQVGYGQAYLVPPSSSYICNVDGYVLDVENNDLDSIAGKIDASAGAPSPASRATVYNWTVTEGDTFQRQMTVSTTALADYGLTDLSTVTSITAAARTKINRIDTSPDFTMQAWISDATAMTVIIGWTTFPTGASISGFAITAVSTGSKTVTVSGDKRKFFDGFTRLLVANSTGNDGYYTLSSMAYTGGNTVFTVNETIGNSTGDGTIAQADDSKDFNYDVQVKAPKSFSIVAVSTVSKTFSLSGDQSRYFNVGGSFTVAGSTGNNGTYTVASMVYSGGNTVLTVNETVPNSTADGSISVTFIITVLKGVITITRQEDRT